MPELEERVRSISQAISEGFGSIEEVAERVGLATASTLYYIIIKSIPVPAKFTYKGKNFSQRPAPSTRQRIINKALSEGVNSLEELCKRTHLKPSGLRRFCTAKDITLPRNLIPFKYRPELDVLIEQGLTLGQMKQRLSNTRQAVDVYI